MVSGRRKLRGTMLMLGSALAFMWAVWLQVSTPVHASSPSLRQTARILNVRRVLRSHLFVSRYPQTHDFDVYFAIRIAHQSYCADYETPVLDEIEDLNSCVGKEVEVTLDEKRIVVYTPHQRRLKAHLVRDAQCSPNTVVQATNQ